MSVQRGSLRVTAILAVLTSRGGSTVSAEAVSMTMEAFLLPGSPVWVSNHQRAFLFILLHGLPEGLGSFLSRVSGIELSVCLSVSIPSLTHCPLSEQGAGKPGVQVAFWGAPLPKKGSSNSRFQPSDRRTYLWHVCVALVCLFSIFQHLHR